MSEANPEEGVDKGGSDELEVDDEIITVKPDMIEDLEDLTTLFAVRTTINQESNILRQIFYRFKILDVIPDIKAMLVSPLLPGYIFIEASQKRDVQIAIQGIPHIKGRIVGQIKLSEINHVLVPRSVTEFLEEGDKVEIISGVFEGARALVMRMPAATSSTEEVVVRLLQEETPITIKIHGDYLKLVEKKTPTKEPIPEIRMKTPEEIATDLEKMISFDDELGEMEEEAVEGEYSASTSEDYEDEEWDEDDEWSKFDGF
jgi:transcription elongation factor Spt5